MIYLRFIACVCCAACELVMKFRVFCGLAVETENEKGIMGFLYFSVCLNI